MARRKKPEGETVEQRNTRRLMETVADAATRSEKVSWERKMDNMNKLIDKLRPIEDQILDLMTLKMPIIDEVAALRKEMMQECVHPYTYLVERDGVVECKFCNKRFTVVTNDRPQT